jgi:hypothetical protein
MSVTATLSKDLLFILRILSFFSFLLGRCSHNKSPVCIVACFIARVLHVSNSNAIEGLAVHTEDFVVFLIFSWQMQS